MGGDGYGDLRREIELIAVAGMFSAVIGFELLDSGSLRNIYGVPPKPAFIQEKLKRFGTLDVKVL